MSNEEMFKKSFQRPSNFFTLTTREQWEIDKKLGILDWEGDSPSIEDVSKYLTHYSKGSVIGRMKGSRVARALEIKAATSVPGEMHVIVWKDDDTKLAINAVFDGEHVANAYFKKNKVNPNTKVVPMRHYDTIKSVQEEV